MTQEQIDIITAAAKKLAQSYTFPGFELKDLTQYSMELAQIAINEGRYDNKRPFGNFIYVHLRNRLFNNKRDKWVNPVKHKVAHVTHLTFDPENPRNRLIEKDSSIESEELLDQCPVELRSTLLRVMYRCKVTQSRKVELNEWLKNHVPSEES